MVPLASATERLAKAQTGADPAQWKARQEALLTLFRDLRVLAVSVEKGIARVPQRDTDVLALIESFGSQGGFDRLYLARALVARLLRERQKPYAKILGLLSLVRVGESPALTRIADEMAADALLSPAVLAGITKAENNVRDQLDALLALLNRDVAGQRLDLLWTLLAERLPGSVQLRRSVEHQFVVKLRGREAFCDTPDAALLRLDEFAPRLLAGRFTPEMRPPVAVALIERYCMVQNQGGSLGRRMALRRIKSAVGTLGVFCQILQDLSAGYGSAPGAADVADAIKEAGIRLAVGPGAAA